MIAGFAETNSSSDVYRDSIDYSRVPATYYTIANLHTDERQKL